MDGLSVHRYCPGRTTMKRFGEGHYLRPSRMKRGQFQRVFVGFRTGVAQEKSVVGMIGKGTQFISQFLLLRNLDGVGVKRNFMQLIR